MLGVWERSGLESGFVDIFDLIHTCYLCACCQHCLDNAAHLTGSVGKACQTMMLFVVARLEC